MVFYIILLLLWARVCYFICMCYFCSYEMVIMKNLFRTVSVIALAGWFLACSEKKSESCYEIIPAPLEIRENFSGGEFVLDDGVCIVYPGENEAMRHKRFVSGGLPESGYRTGLPGGNRFAREEKCNVTIRFEY